MSSNKKKKEIESQKYENESKQLSKNKPVKKKKLRCATCNKKLGLLGFECKCGMLFCSSHLLAEYHNCTYDFKTEQCKRLEKSLVKVVHEKVPRI